VPKVVLFSRPGCHLCEDARAVLDEVRRATPFDLEERDISGDGALEAAYRHDIPVVTVDGVEAFRHVVRAEALRARLAAAATVGARPRAEADA
jgi:glutaredoxin